MRNKQLHGKPEVTRSGVTPKGTAAKDVVKVSTPFSKTVASYVSLMLLIESSILAATAVGSWQPDWPSIANFLWPFGFGVALAVWGVRWLALKRGK